MIEQFLDAITENRDKYARGRIVIQTPNDNWQEMRAWVPRKTVYNRCILPGQKMIRYRHSEMCAKESRKQFQSGALYYAWFYLYLTPEEYTMLKLQDGFYTGRRDS